METDDKKTLSLENIKKMFDEMLDEKLEPINSKLSGFRRDLDGVYEGKNNSMSPDFLAAVMSQAQPLQFGPETNRFRTGRAKKMQLLSQLNIGT